ncbi:MAG: transposase [Alicyclobacillus macrosporangiidus]|nr:transposase [Alicyclobacillus macrosporangiidus]
MRENCTYGLMRRGWVPQPFTLQLVACSEDGNLEPDNYPSERSIKPFSIGRKNWLFVNTPCEAWASVVAYSIVQTGKENGLHPLASLEYLFEQFRISIRQGRDGWPWTEVLPATGNDDVEINPHAVCGGDVL